MAKFLVLRGHTLKYGLKYILQNWTSAPMWKRLIRRFLIMDIIGYLYFGILKTNKGIYVMEGDWDNLIILDACRYDLFKEVTGRSVDCVISRGSATSEFVLENFAGKKFNDTVVVTGNPFLNRLAGNSFHSIVSVWRDGWDPNSNTVLPQTVLQYAVETEKNYPDKRLIVWFMQPHQPFIEDPEISSTADSQIYPWEEASKGNLPTERVWEAYRRNLEIAVFYAFELAKKLKGKTVLTSDHGEALTRLRFPIPVKITGHIPRIHILELVKVPWLVFEGEERKEIRKGEKPEKRKIKAKIKKLKDSGAI